MWLSSVTCNGLTNFDSKLRIRVVTVVGLTLDQSRHESAMRLHPNSLAYQELHRRLDAARSAMADSDLTPAEMEQKLRDVRDAYMKELLDASK